MIHHTGPIHNFYTWYDFKLLFLTLFVPTSLFKIGVLEKTMTWRFGWLFQRQPHQSAHTWSNESRLSSGGTSLFMRVRWGGASAGCWMVLVGHDLGVVETPPSNVDQEPEAALSWLVRVPVSPAQSGVLQQKQTWELETLQTPGLPTPWWGSLHTGLRNLCLISSPDDSYIH